MRSLFINSVAVRVISFLLVGTLLAASLFGLYQALTTPTEREVSTPVLNYEQQGKFHYMVHLKPNTLFDTTVLGPGQVYFARLINAVRMTFSYHLASDQPLEEAGFNYHITAIFGSQGLWEKSFTLVPPTMASDDFTVSFALPIPQFMELMDTIREETGARTASPQLTVKARVQPQVQTAHGPIAEPFEQTLVFTFEGDTIGVGEELEKSQQGTITETRLVPVPGLERLRNAAGGGVLASLLLLAGLIWMYTQVQAGVPRAEKELQRARKKHQELLVRAQVLPPVRDDQIVIRLDSLPDLLNMAEETFRPVIYSTNGDGYTYCVIDGSGSMRYEYSDTEEREETEKLEGEGANDQ